MKENMLYGPREILHIEFLSKPLLTKYFLFGQVTYFINQCYRIRDATVFAILIRISFKLNLDIDRLKLSNILIYYFLIQ